MANPHTVKPSDLGLVACVLLALAVAEPAIAQTPTEGRPVLEIGKADGSEVEAFGFIGDVEVGSSGDVFILDMSATSISWFGADGTFKRLIGRSGGGPGEFRRPISMAIDGQERLHVYDVGNGRISIYALSATEATHIADQKLDRQINALCTVNNRRFVLIPQQDMVLGELDENGRVMRVFGPAEEPDVATARRFSDARPTMHRFFNHAVMTCDAQSETIVLLQENIPIVRAFDVDGTLQWRTKLSDYHERELFRGTMGDGFGFRIDPAIGSAHSGSAVAIVPGRRVAVTLWEGSPSDMEGSLDERSLDLSDGREVERSVPLARLVRILNDRRYGYLQLPYPRVLIYEP